MSAERDALINQLNIALSDDRAAIIEKLHLAALLVIPIDQIHKVITEYKRLNDIMKGESA